MTRSPVETPQEKSLDYINFFRHFDRGSHVRVNSICTVGLNGVTI